VTVQEIYALLVLSGGMKLLEQNIFSCKFITKRFEVYFQMLQCIS